MARVKLFKPLLSPERQPKTPSPRKQKRKATIDSESKGVQDRSKKGVDSRRASHQTSGREARTPSPRKRSRKSPIKSEEEVHQDLSMNTYNSPEGPYYAYEQHVQPPVDKKHRSPTRSVNLTVPEEWMATGFPQEDLDPNLDHFAHFNEIWEQQQRLPDRIDTAPLKLHTSDIPMSLIDPQLLDLQPTYPVSETMIGMDPATIGGDVYQDQVENVGYFPGISNSELMPELGIEQELQPGLWGGYPLLDLEPSSCSIPPERFDSGPISGQDQAPVALTGGEISQTSKASEGFSVTEYGNGHTHVTIPYHLQVIFDFEHVYRETALSGKLGGWSNETLMEKLQAMQDQSNRAPRVYDLEDIDMIHRCYLELRKGGLFPRDS